MAVTTKFGMVKNRSGNTFTGQNIGGAVMGIVGATGSVISAMGLSLIEGLANSVVTSTQTKQRAYGSGSGLVSSTKAISSGAYGYGNNVPAGSYIISRITTSIAGVANTALLFMGQATKVATIHEFKHDFGVKNLTAWVGSSFAWTGKLANGNSKLSRLMWLNAASTAVITPSVLNGTFMFDITDANATDKAVDSAANPTRAIPGEFIMKVDFVVNSLSTSGNKFNYKPITGF